MEWIAVTSSNIGAIAHQNNPDTLFVQFLSGMTYQYDGVSRATFDDMLAAGSKGTFLNEYIKGSYSYSKI